MSDPIDTAAVGAPSPADDDETGALLSRLRLIEDQPLADRAEALSQLHDELRMRLESGDAPRTHG